MYDVYQNKNDHSLRMATLPGAGLPDHVDPKDWKLMKPGTSQLHEDTAKDIEERGFSFFKLVK